MMVLQSILERRESQCLRSKILEEFLQIMNIEGSHSISLWRLLQKNCNYTGVGIGLIGREWNREPMARQEEICCLRKDAV